MDSSGGSLVPKFHRVFGLVMVGFEQKVFNSMLLHVVLAR